MVFIMLHQETNTYAFVGNREYVLREMIKKDLIVAGVFVMENSFLHKVLTRDPFINYQIVSNRNQLLRLLNNTNYDIMISNGCKYILPIEKMKNAKYINIHPSYLPDLKGKDPINGACLLNRTAGATCHIMDDGIDTGKIVARIKIEMTDDIEAALLFQLCFKAEVLAFINGFARGFEELEVQPAIDNAVYYSISVEDYLVNFNKGVDYILRQTKAFGYKSKGLYFKCRNIVFCFFKASEITNQFVINYCRNFDNLVVLFVFENSIIFKCDSRVIRFDQIDELQGRIAEGDRISLCTVDDIVQS